MRKTASQMREYKRGYIAFRNGVPRSQGTGRDWYDGWEEASSSWYSHLREQADYERLLYAQQQEEINQQWQEENPHG